MDNELMTEDEFREIEKKEEKPKKEKKKKRYLVTNRENRPYEFHIVNDYFRLEPRNTKNDSVEMKENQINSEDFQVAKKHVNIKEI